MKLILLTLFIFATSALADEWDPIDWSRVIPREDEPGFWDGREAWLRPKIETIQGRPSRIRGGAEVTPHSHPYAVAILSSTASATFSCGASIISTRSILTAAHCPIGTLSTVAIAGAHNRQVNEPTQQRATIAQASYRLHPSYNPSNLHNDIGVLIMPAPGMTTSATVQFSTLPHAFRNELFAGEMVSIVGWGRTCTTCAGSNTLRGTRQPIITNAACGQFFSGVSQIHFFCMHDPSGQSGTCPGDSGGPYTIVRGGNSRLQIGVHCFGAGSGVGGCDAGWPSGATRVTQHLDWLDINAIM